MAETKQIRLIVAAKEFNVGLLTIVDFLKSKGYELKNSPMERMSEKMYEVLREEFGTKVNVLFKDVSRQQQLKEKLDRKIKYELDNRTGVLYLNNCDLSEIPDIIMKMEWLTLLDLGRNKLTNIDKIKNLVWLKHLNLESNNLDSVEGIANFQDLENLNISNNNFLEFSGINLSKKITNFDFSNNLYLLNNVELCNYIENLSNLTILNLARCGLELINLKRNINCTDPL